MRRNTSRLPQAHKNVRRYAEGIGEARPSHDAVRAGEDRGARGTLMVVGMRERLGPGERS